MGQASLTERTSAYAPSSGAARKRERQRRILIRVQTDLQSNIASAATEHLVHRLSKQILARAVDQPQAPLGIEGENGNVDFRHDRPEQSGRFERAEALQSKRLAERIYFQHRLPESVVDPGAPGANRIVSFAQRGEQVRHRLQGADD